MWYFFLTWLFLLLSLLSRHLIFFLSSQDCTTLNKEQQKAHKRMMKNSESHQQVSLAEHHFWGHYPWSQALCRKEDETETLHEEEKPGTEDPERGNGKGKSSDKRHVILCWPQGYFLWLAHNDFLWTFISCFLKSHFVGTKGINMISCKPAHPEGHVALLTLSCLNSVSNVSPEAKPFLVYSLGLRRQRRWGVSHILFLRRLRLLTGVIIFFSS